MSDTFDIYEIGVPSWDASSCPIDLSRATQWEEQEIRRTWLNTVRLANNLTAMGAHFSERLQTTTGRFGPHGDVGSIDMGGDFQPAYAANQFVVSATKLKGLVDGMTHRLAMERQRLTQAEIDIEYAIAHGEDEGS